MAARLIILILVFFSHAGLTLAVTYDELRASGIKSCEAIDRSAYQTGLTLNPDGYRSYYVRSECFQRVAIEFRDERLCAEVKERWSLLSSSWGYSRSNCQKRLRAGIDDDRKVLQERRARYLQGPVRLLDFTIQANGNGRDFDIVPTFSGAASGGYWLRFDIVLPLATPQTVLLHAAGYHVNGGANMRLFVTGEEIRRRTPQFALGRAYLVRASMMLSIGIGGQAGKWSDEFVEKTFPAAERTQVMEKEIRFSATR